MSRASNATCAPSGQTLRLGATFQALWPGRCVSLLVILSCAISGSSMGHSPVSAYRQPCPRCFAGTHSEVLRMCCRPAEQCIVAPLSAARRRLCPAPTARAPPGLCRLSPTRCPACAPPPASRPLPAGVYPEVVSGAPTDTRVIDTVAPSIPSTMFPMTAGLHKCVTMLHRHNWHVPARVQGFSQAGRLCSTSQYCVLNTTVVPSHVILNNSHDKGVGDDGVRPAGTQSARRTRRRR